MHCRRRNECIPWLYTPLQFELQPKDASEDQLIYEVSNDVISVDKKGNIFGNLLGDSEVTIKAKDNPSVQKTIEVHIVQTCYRNSIKRNRCKTEKRRDLLVNSTGGSK